MSDYKVTYDGVDLSPCCERGMTDYVFTIDPVGADYLGPATSETRAEVKAAPAMRTFNAVLMTVVLIVTGLVLMGAGVYIGATDPSVWTDLPFTPEPSGERAEPEESAR